MEKEFMISDYIIISSILSKLIHFEQFNSIVSGKLTLAPTAHAPVGVAPQVITKNSNDLLWSGIIIMYLSGPMLKNILKQLNLIYLNSDEHTHMDRAKDSTAILDIAFIITKFSKT